MKDLTEERITVLADTLHTVRLEAEAASKKWPPFRSVHEGYAVILEEQDELWAECKAKHPDKDKLWTEASHVAVMALRFMAELPSYERRPNRSE
jgi:hypothetical protein